MNWIRISVAAGGFVIVALIFIIVIIRKEFKTVIERLFIYLLIATLLREATLFSNIEHQIYYKQQEQVCSILGALNLYTANVVFIIVASAIVYLLNRVVDGELYHRMKTIAKAFELGLVIISFTLPFVMSASLLYTDIFGSSVAWCWTQEYVIINGTCHKTNVIKKVFGGYSVLLVTGFLSIFLTATMVTIYCKVAHRIKKASHLLKQAVILIICLVLNSLIIVFSALATNLAAIEVKLIVLYTYTTVISFFDLIYPLGFLVILKYQAIVSWVHTERSRSSYTPIPKSNANATAPFSDRVTARSTTISITAQHTGEFTTVHYSE